MAHDVFISYSNKDKSVADTICARLEDQHIRCWIAPRDILPGKNFAESIILAINESKAFILVWSINTNTSEHILNEINQAFDKGVPIIPFRIQEVEPTLAMRYYFGRTHWLDALTPPLEKHVEALAATIRGFLESRPAVPVEGVPIVRVPSAETRKGEEPSAAAPEPEDLHPLGKKEAVELQSSQPFEMQKPRKVEQTPPGMPKVPAESLARKKSIHPAVAIGMAVLAILMIAFIGFFKNIQEAFMALAPSRTSTPTSSPIPATSTITPTWTRVPTFTATPPPAWVEQFAAPVLAAIRSSTPDFQDDFSRMTTNWYYTTDPPTGCVNSGMTNVTGRMQFQVEYGCYAGISLNNVELTNFAVQVDLDLKELDPPYHVQIAVGDHDNLSLQSDGHWGTIDCSPACYFSQEGYVSFSQSSPVTVILISLGRKNAAFINDNPVLFFEDISDHWASLLQVKLAGDGGSSRNKMYLDNVKVWFLDNIAGLATLNQ